MASTANSSDTARAIARARAERRAIEQKNAQDPEIEEVKDSGYEEVPIPPSSPDTQISAVPSQDPDAAPAKSPKPSPGEGSAWQRMQDAGISTAELLSQQLLWEEFRKLKESIEQKQPAPVPATPVAQGDPSLHVKLSEFSMFKPQQDFTGRDQEFNAYVRKFLTRAEALLVPETAYTRLFLAQLGNVALNFAKSNKITVDTPFDEMVRIMNTGPWIRQVTDLSGRRRLFYAPYKNKPTHEAVKFVEERFLELPTEPNDADKIFYLSANLSDVVQARTELSPSGLQWKDYNAYRTFVLQIGAVTNPLNPNPSNYPNVVASQQMSNANVPPGIGPLQYVRSDRNPQPRRHNDHGHSANHNNDYGKRDHKRAKHNPSVPAGDASAGSAWTKKISHMKCAACGRPDHMARDSKDGKTPICKKYDPSKGPLIKKPSKNGQSQR